MVESSQTAIGIYGDRVKTFDKLEGALTELHPDVDEIGVTEMVVGFELYETTGEGD